MLTSLQKNKLICEEGKQVFQKEFIFDGRKYSVLCWKLL